AQAGPTGRSSDPHVPRKVIINEQDPLSQQTLDRRARAAWLPPHLTTHDFVVTGSFTKPAANLARKLDMHLVDCKDSCGGR
ncbi:hypothetical protein, partial [Streptomyces griseofuscus]|uniref:hypothetical protein n=1 Tax=Streptomyces griseofuscus TaxID=146922 RepID=UPI00369F3D61